MNSKTIVFLLTLFTTGLSAGLFYAWWASVLPGFKNVTDDHYLHTFQSINRAILNPGFFITFFGALILLAISTVITLKNGYTPQFYWMLAGLLFYMGTFFITAFGNVPLNNSLDQCALESLSEAELQTFRNYFELHWNRLHIIRTIFAMLSFLASSISLFFTSN